MVVAVGLSSILDTPCDSDISDHRLPNLHNMTEKDVKAEVKKIFKCVAPRAYLFWPVQSGYGASDLDLIASVDGFCLRVETKVHGRKPTPRQRKVTDDLTAAGVPVLWIDETNLNDLEVVLGSLLEGEQGLAFDYSAVSRRRF